VKLPLPDLPKPPKLPIPKLPKIPVPKPPKIQLPKPPKIPVPKLPKLPTPKLPKIQVPKIQVPKPPKFKLPKLPKLPKPPRIPGLKLPGASPPKNPFSSVQSDPGSFERKGSLKIDLSGQEAKVQVGGHDVPMVLAGKIDLGFCIKVTIDLVQVGPVKLPKPGALPRVTASFPTKVDLKADREDVARRLFAALEPEEALRALSGVGNLVSDAYRPLLEDAFDGMKGGFDLQSWPFWKHSGPLRKHLERSFQNACAPGRAHLAQEFRRRLLPLLGGLEKALRQVAEKEVLALGEHLRKGVELLLLVGSQPRDLIERLGQKLAEALRKTADPARMKVLWDHAGWLAGLALEANVGVVKPLMARLLVAARDRFDDHREHAEDFLEQGLRRLGGRGVEAVSFVQELLVAVRDAAGASVQQHARFFSRLAVVSAKAAADAARCEWASALGAFVGVFAKGDAPLDPLLEAFIDAVKDVRKLVKDEVFELLRHVGDEAMLKRFCLWIRDHWERFEAIVAGAFAEVKEWIDLMAGFLAQAAGLPKQIEELQRLFRWLQGAAKTLLRSPEFLDAQTFLSSFERALEGGVVQWLDEEARRRKTTMAQVFKDFVTRTNALVALLKKLTGAVNQIVGDVKETGAEALDAWKKAVEGLEEWNRRLWGIVFGGEMGQSPVIFVARAEGLLSEPLEIEGGAIEKAKPVAQPASIKPGELPVVPLPTGLSPDTTFVALEAYLDRLRVPHPCEMRPMQWGGNKPPEAGLRIPLGPLVPWDASVAVAHLPEFWVMDMRYHMPYGDVGLFKVADLDRDGFVRDWEVEALRKAVSAGDDAYDASLDCDGDGKITADDLQLAIEQQRRYVNGIMYRPMTGPFGIWCSFSPYDWFFNAMGALRDESIEGKVERDGIIAVIDGQLVLPVVDYPIRYHLEQRMFLDRFPELALLPGLAPATPSVRIDAIARGGRTGRDWQAYFTTEPANPMLRTWVLRGTIFLRGLITGAYFIVGAESGAGAAGKADFRIQAVYETSTPLIAVIQQWHDRVKNVSEAKPDEIFPVPFDLFKSIIEHTDVPRLCRSLIQVAGPFVDLFFDWCDEEHRVRGGLGYLRQTVLNKWRPAPTWAQLRHEISEWPPEEIAGEEREAVLGALGEVQADLAAADDDAVYEPAAAARAAREALAKLDGGDSAAAEKVAALFADRPRFAAGFDQLVEDVDAEAVEIPGCGRHVIRNPKIVAVPFAYKDVKNVQNEKHEASVDELLAVRGNPFFKPIYHSIVEFGPDAKLYTAPTADVAHFIEPVGAGGRGLVEGARALEDEDGHWWLWVRLESWRHGWLRLDKEVVERIFSTTGDVERAAESIAGIVKEAAREVLSKAVDPALLDRLEAFGEDLRGKRTIARIEASPRDTVDETRYARHAYGAVARAAMGREEPGDRVKPVAPGLPATGMLDVLEDCLAELKIRVFGWEEREKTDDELAEAFNALSHAQREKLWASAPSWLKLRHYTPIIAEHIISALVPLIFEGRFQEAWELVLEMLRQTADVPFDEAVVAAQSAAPGIKEVVLTVLSMGQKVKKLGDMVTKGEGDVARDGKVPPAGTKGAGAPSFQDSGVMLARLLIDDGEEPGRPPAPKSDGKGKDQGISFSFSASVKDKEPEEGADGAKDEERQDPTEYWVLLAEPAVGAIGEVPDDIEVGDEIDLVVTQWAALVRTDPPQTVVGVGADRIPPEIKAEVKWRVYDGAEWTPIAERGERIRYVFPAELEDAEEITFEAYLGEPPPGVPESGEDEDDEDLDEGEYAEGGYVPDDDDEDDEDDDDEDDENP